MAYHLLVYDAQNEKNYTTELLISEQFVKGKPKIVKAIICSNIWNVNMNRMEAKRGSAFKMKIGTEFIHYFTYEKTENNQKMPDSMVPYVITEDKN